MRTLVEFVAGVKNSSCDFVQVVEYIRPPKVLLRYVCERIRLYMCILI